MATLSKTIPLMYIKKPSHSVFAKTAVLLFTFLLSGVLISCNSSKPSDELKNAAKDSLKSDQSENMAIEPYDKADAYTGETASDSILRFEEQTRNIKNMIHMNGANREFRYGYVNGDTAQFQLVENMDDEHSVWRFDFSQTEGNFSAIKFPQIGRGEEVTEINRDYYFNEGELFYVTDAIFTKGKGGSQVIHSNYYVFSNGKIQYWYREKDHQMVKNKYYTIVDNLFPSVDGYPILKWANDTFKDPKKVFENFHLLEASGENSAEAINSMIEKMQDSTSIIKNSQEIGWKDGSQLVLAIDFSTESLQKGVVMLFDKNMQSNTINLYNPELFGIAYSRGNLCKSIKDVIATLNYAKRTNDLLLAKDFIPKEGLLFGNPLDSTELKNKSSELIERSELKISNIPNPLYFGNYTLEPFNEQGVAIYRWWLPGSAESMYFKKKDGNIFWYGFEGAYH